MMLSDVCLSCTSGLSREQKPRKTKIGTEVAHVTRDSDTTFKVKRSRSPGHFAHRRVGVSGGCSSGRGNVLAVGNCCYIAVCSMRFGAHGKGEGQGHIVAAALLQPVDRMDGADSLCINVQLSRRLVKTTGSAGVKRFTG